MALKTLGKIMMLIGIFLLISIFLSSSGIPLPELPNFTDLPELPLPDKLPAPYPDTPSLGEWYDVETGTECTKYCVDLGMTPTCAVCPNVPEYTGAVYGNYKNGNACTGISIEDKVYCTAGVRDEIWELIPDPWFTEQKCACVEVEVDNIGI